MNKQNIQEIIDNIESHESEGLKKICFIKTDPEAVFHFHSNKKGDFFNRVRQIQSSNSSITELINRVSSFYSNLGINPVISFNPLTTPDNLDKILIEKGYSVNTFCVFILEEYCSQQDSNQKELFISDTKNVEEFADIFSKNFANQNEDFNSLRDRIEQNMTFKDNLHLVAKLNDKLVGSVGSIGFNGIYVIYGLSISQEFRGNGFGGLLGREIIKRLSAKKPKLVYFKSKTPLVVEAASKFGFRKVYEQLYFKL